MSQGYPATPHGMNTEGLKRRGFDSDAIRNLRNAYKLVFRKGLTLAEALEQLEQDFAGDEAVAVFIESLKASDRGIIR